MAEYRATGSSASPATCQPGMATDEEIGKWAKLNARGPMKGAHRYLEKNEFRALGETCVDPE
eukprot:4697548-Pyramimonas_sp.AAC.1